MRLIIGIATKATDVPCGGLCELYAVPHPHAQEFNIEQHTPCGEKSVSHMETDAKSNANGTIQRDSQAILWHHKKLHNPIKRN